MTLLSLFEDSGLKSTLLDYEFEAPGEKRDLSWRFKHLTSINRLPSDNGMRRRLLLNEFDSVWPHYDAVRNRARRTTVGVGLLGIDEIADFVCDFLQSNWPKSPRPGMHPVQALRYVTDDLKAFYTEAATSFNGNPSADQLSSWFWGSTVAGKLLIELRHILLSSNDEIAADIADGAIVPRSIIGELT